MFTQCSVQDNIIRSLDNKPIDGGLTPDQLKDKFDEGYEGIKNYINNTLLPELFCPASIINGNFRYPVNQYGRTSGAAFSTSDTYFVDMWKLVSGSVTWAAGTGFSLNGVLKQYFEVVPTDLYDEKLPVSINVGGTDYVKLMTFPSNTTDTDTETAGAVTITVGYEEKSSNLCGVAVTHVPYISLTTSSAVTIKYVYSVTPPADYGEELHKCQRYFYCTGVGGVPNAVVFMGGGTIYGHVYVRFPVTMRIAPTVTFFSVLGTQGNITNTADYTDISVQGAGGPGKDSFSVIDSSVPLTAGNVYAFHYAASAEL